jgi:hypothetical protein
VPQEVGHEGIGADEVPVYTFLATLNQDENQPYHSPIDVIRDIFRRVYEEVLRVHAGSRAADANDYAQIRLQRPGGADVFFDVVSDLVPYYEVVDEFLVAFELLLQSERNKEERRTGGFLAEMPVMIFAITFVLAKPNSEAAPLTVNNVGQIRRYAASFASNSVQQQGVNPMLTRNRWIRQNEYGVQNRTAAMDRGYSAQQLAELRQKAYKETRFKRKRAAPVPAELSSLLDPNNIAALPVARAPTQKRPKVAREYTQQEGKRKYTQRRSPEELAAIRSLGPDVQDVANYTLFRGIPIKTGRVRQTNWTEEQRLANNALRRQKYKEKMTSPKIINTLVTYMIDYCIKRITTTLESNE